MKPEPPIEYASLIDPTPLQLSTSFATDMSNSNASTIPDALSQHYWNMRSCLEYFISEYNALAARYTNLQQTGGDDIELQISKARIQTLENLVHSKDNEIAQLRKVIEQLKLRSITTSVYPQTIPTFQRKPFTESSSEIGSSLPPAANTKPSLRWPTREEKQHQMAFHQQDSDDDAFDRDLEDRRRRPIPPQEPITAEQSMVTI